MRVLVLVGMPVWWSIQRGHVLRGSLRGLEADRGDFPDFRGVVVGHAVREEGGVPGVGCFHLVPYGVPIMKPCRTNGRSGYVFTCFAARLLA